MCFPLGRNSSREALWPGNAGSYISPEIPSFQPRESGKGDACSRGQGIHIFPIPAFPWRDSARGSMPWLVNIDPANPPWTGFACDPQLQGLPAGPPSIGARVHLEALPHAVPGLGLRGQGRGPREGLVLVTSALTPIPVVSRGLAFPPGAGPLLVPPRHSCPSVCPC